MQLTSNAAAQKPPRMLTIINQFDVKQQARNRLKQTKVFENLA